MIAELPPYLAYEDCKAAEYSTYKEAEDPHADDYPGLFPYWYNPSSNFETYEPPRYTGNPGDGRAVRHVEDQRLFAVVEDPRLGTHWPFYNGAVCLARVLCPPGHLLTINRIETYIRACCERGPGLRIGSMVVGNDDRYGMDDLFGFYTWLSQWVIFDSEDTENAGARLAFVTGLRRYGQPWENQNPVAEFLPSPYGVYFPWLNYLPITFYGIPMWQDSRYRHGLPYNNTKILVPESNWFELWALSWGWYPWDENQGVYKKLLAGVAGRLVGHLQDYHGNPEAYHFARQALG